MTAFSGGLAPAFPGAVFMMSRQSVKFLFHAGALMIRHDASAGLLPAVFTTEAPGLGHENLIR
ncbi:hypothetical protein OI70_13110 [Dickeya fangzhongdai]|nr:hypothetical protein OI70_13110 [Dickeya fangzhongdai]